MKQVLLLGDSLRMGYQPVVQKMLEGKAEVSGPEENGRWAGYTLNSFRFWIPDLPKPDIIHWNNVILKNVAARHQIPVDDLFPVLKPMVKEYVGEDGIHLKAEGYEAVAKQVVASIQPYL